MMIVGLTILAALAALAGGYVALQSRHKLYIAMALTSGLILGLVAFDLLPEIFAGSQQAGHPAVWPMVLFVLGFIGFHAMEKFVVVHEADESTYKPHSHPNLGVARAVALAGHSLLDGLSIGVAFQVNIAVGFSVAAAVIGHRFADGFDTTSFMLYHGNSIQRIRQLLAVVVVMPILGGVLSLVVSVPDYVLTLYLGFFAGVLMYIAASNILPQAHTKYRPQVSFACLLLGIMAMFALTQVAAM